MDRNSVMALDLAMMEHNETIKAVNRRQRIKEASNAQSVARFAGIRGFVGRSLISAGEWIRIEECERQAEELAGDPMSMGMAR